MDQVNYTTQKAWKALHFVMRVLKKGKYEYKKFSLHVIGTSCSWVWVCMLVSMQRRTDTCVRHSMEGVAQFTNRTKDSDWENLAHRRTIACLCALFNPLTPNEPYSGRTAPLTFKRCILYIYSTNIGTEYFKHGIYSPFFLSLSLQNAVYFIILTYLVPVLFTFYIQVC